MAALCDLHIHSNYSDGTVPPAQLIRLAEEANLAAVALCDHNTVKGIPEFLTAAKNSPVEAVAGIEFSTEYQDQELHILGLFVEPEHYDAINRRLDEALQRKEQSNIALIERLKQLGINLDYWKIKAETAGSINRAVIASYMVRGGYCSSIKEAFDTWLSKERGLYVAPKLPDALETVRFIKSIGAVAVLAHPFLSMKEESLREFLSQAKELDGMEVYYSKFSGEQTALAERIAEEFGLVKSGGSDFHGDNKPDIRIGVGRGNLAVPMTQLEELKNRIRQ